MFWIWKNSFDAAVLNTRKAYDLPRHPDELGSKITQSHAISQERRRRAYGSSNRDTKNAPPKTEARRKFRLVF